MLSKGWPLKKQSLSKSRSERKVASKVGLLLLEKELISEQQLATALKIQQETGKRLGQTLVEMGAITSFQLNKALCRQKWLRSAFAGIVIAATPICPVLADEKVSINEPGFNQSQFDDTQSGNIDRELKFAGTQNSSGYLLGFRYQQTASTFSSSVNTNAQLAKGAGSFMEPVDLLPGEAYRIGLSKAFSNKLGIEVSVGAKALIASGEQYVVSPQISFYTSSDSGFNSEGLQLKNRQIQRFDRYKNTIPAVYRITLKGYALYESRDNRVETLGFNKVDFSEMPSYTLMFSFVKKF
ncbi:hypothetical protein [Aliikangiella sp. G2MR2-5]|uniref:hypothetical protein n=1 Tax=Aliikangiella sp. G2MR2-5 TaxID=2788943 RepID=UPI0018A97D8A|nr:hypothetical protein [Aliikangiella sp. G2MR2-5]